MTKITRRRFLEQTVATAAAAGLSQFPFNAFASEETLTPLGAKSRKSPPNIVFIMGDDMGFADLSCYGRRDYRTKFLDKLAKQGVMLTHHYSNSPVCSATRVAFNTGRYQQRLPIGTQEPVFYAKDMRDLGLIDKIGIPPEFPTIATLLKNAGYRTALFGKWHCGYLPTFGPVKNGYEEFFGFLSGGVDHFTYHDDYDEPDLWQNESPAEDMGIYDTTLLTDKAVDFIKRQKKGQPFFLNLAFHGSHWPWEGPNDVNHPRDQPYPQALEAFNHGSPAKYAEMITALDAGVGKVLKVLENRNLDRNTIVVFVSDNGGERYSDVWPFVGSKGHLYEGGIRVPGIVRWPGHLPQGKVSDQASVTFDWFATFLAAAGVQPDPNYPLDGIDLTPILQSAGKKSHQTVPRTLFWRFKGQYAVRDGNLKYLYFPKNTDVIKLTDLPGPGDHFDEIGTEYLFNLALDYREQNNLSNTYVQTYFGASEPPEIVRLRQLFADWNATMLPEQGQTFGLKPRV